MVFYTVAVYGGRRDMRYLKALAAFALLGFVSLQPSTARAETKLVCEEPKYRGVIHCAADGGSTHLVKIDLTASGLRLETLMANDVDTVNPATAQRELVSGMAARYKGQGIALAINADYFSVTPQTDTHGPEGFTVKQGRRIDGQNSNDTDDNLVRRSSISISGNNAVEMGPKTLTDADNPASYKSRFYNAVGGGPLIVLEGKALTNAQACVGKDAKWVDGFEKDKCSSAAQSAVGLSSDGSTLYFVMTGARTAEKVAQLLVEQGAYTAMKLDGGASSQLWYGGKAFYAAGAGRPVANALAVFAYELPEYDAAPPNQVGFTVINLNESTDVLFGFKNTGRLAWKAGAGIQLVHVGGQLMGAKPSLPLSADVLPGQTTRLIQRFTMTSTVGIYQTAWQLKRNGQAIGQPLTVNIIVLPGDAKDLKTKIERELSDWKDQGELKADEISKKVTEEITRYMASEGLKGVRSICGAPAALLIGVAGVVIVTNRRRRG